MTLVVVASVATVTTATDAPASATPYVTPCNDDGSWKGPYWWGSVQASNSRGHRMLLTPTSPDFGAPATVWTAMGYTTQEFWLDCVGYDWDQDQFVYQLRLVYDNSLCLSAPGKYALTNLQTCLDSYFGYQGFELIDLHTSRGVPDPTGTGSPSYGSARVYGFYSPWQGTCLQEWAPNDGDGVIMGDCAYGPNQLWY